MKSSIIIDRLSEAGIRPTATRILIYQYVMEHIDTFSLHDIEDTLISIDKSTIFRTLILFKDHHIIHSIEYGSGAVKYCQCRNQGDSEEEFHCHFYCEKCKKTYCFDNIKASDITMPKGFVMHQINYIVKGICDKCSS